MAKRGYNRDTIRGGASEWDVSRPFTSYIRLLASLFFHPVRFFEVLPRIPAPTAPALFLGFSGLPAALLWLLFESVVPALFALVAPLPVSLTLAALYYLGTWDGKHGYVVTWRVAAYPVGFLAPLAAIPLLRWAAAVYFGVALMAVGLAVVREVGTARAALAATVVPGLLLFGVWWALHIA